MSVIAATHFVVNSGRPASHRFGAGILASRPFAGFKPYTQADLEAAAAMFADASQPDYDAMAAESLAIDRLSAGICF